MPSIITGIQQQADQLTSNSNVTETSQWENSIYLIDEQDYVHGGIHGYDNVPHEQLANRTTYLKDVCDKTISDLQAFKQAVSNQDTANANEFATLRTYIRTLQTDLTNLTNVVNSQDSKFIGLINQLRADLQTLDKAFLTHDHRYAGSDVAGGDANTVKIIQNLTDKIMLVGATANDANKLQQSTVYIQNDEVTAKKFIGDLKGAADTANRLTSKSYISFYGDVIASYLFDGSQANIQVKASLANSGVTAGTYGPTTNAVLAMNQSFTVPEFIVDNRGIITGAYNRTYTLPDEAVSGTTNATQQTGKLFLVGAKQQNAKEYTYTNANAYEINGILYSNSKEVVNLNDIQGLRNKTYEGYSLKEACSHGVDYSIQGTDKSKDLITSNAMFNHVHNYAGSNTAGGDANTVKVTKNDVDKRYLVINDGTTGKLEYNTQVTVEKNDLTAPVIHATDMMHIPGGRVWIDTSVQAIDGSSFNPTTLNQIAQMQDDLNALKKLQSTSNLLHTGMMATGVTANAGEIIYYSSGGYRLADNASLNTCLNVGLALENSKTDGSVKVLEYGAYDIFDASHDGEEAYVGNNGRIVFTMPTTKGCIVKPIGHMENNYLIFNGNIYGIQVK